MQPFTEAPVPSLTNDPAPIPQKKLLPFKILLGTNVYNLGVYAIWAAYATVILPYWIQPLVSPSVYPLTIGLIETSGISIAVLINILAGILSDHFVSRRFGRRAPVMLIGTLLTLPFLLLSVFLPVTLPLVAIIYLGSQVFTNVSAAGFQPTLTDFVPVQQRGVSAGLKGVFILLGSALGIIALGPLLAAHQYNAAYILLASVFTVATVANVLVMRPYDKADVEVTPIRFGTAIREMFRLQKVPGGFYWFVFGSFLIYLGLSNFQADAQVYLEVMLHDTRDQAAASLSIFGAVLVVVSVIFAVLAGYLSDKIGRRNVIIGAALGAATLSLVFPFVPQLGRLFPLLSGFGVFLIAAAFYFAFISMVQSVDTALTSDLVPREAAGKYMGYANLAQGVASAVSPTLFGFILNIHGAATPESFLAFFVVTAIFFVLSIFVLSFKVVNR